MTGRHDDNAASTVNPAIDAALYVYFGESTHYFRGSLYCYSMSIIYLHKPTAKL